MKDKLESQEFYELMQAYRHVPLADQKSVVSAFENIKKFIRKNYKPCN